MPDAQRISPPMREMVLGRLRELDKTQGWLAQRMGWSAKVLPLVLWGDMNLTPRRLIDLEEALGVSAEFLVQAYYTYELQFERRARADPEAGQFGVTGWSVET